MPSFSDSIVLAVLALLLFDPKRLPVLARELGKWVGEFRRASSEFKMQMEDELRLSEQTDRNKQIAAMEAAAPVAPPLPEPEHPHLPSESTVVEGAIPAAEAEPAPLDIATAAYRASEAARSVPPEPHTPEPSHDAPSYEMVDGVRTPLPIATSGELKIMPPSTGLPAARESALNGLLNSIPAAHEPATPEPTTHASETTAHGI
jgi:sec-independent protein translocase protein TatB